MTALQAFSREETTGWQHACKTLRRKKKDPWGLLKKTQESCFTTGQQMLLTRLHCQRELRDFRRRLGLLRENFARSIGRLRVHVTWFGRVVSREELMTPTVHQCVVSGWILLALKLCPYLPQGLILTCTAD